ncbi:MAG TPA: transglutaminase-like domain-containing protein [Blastocatellia bacterium]|nr:transglutaminase-like domain-containing protein [Blastocatellia bacterium]HMV87911.1 transglutaminase-like domain-containing protein [Blastocatellia bacterium]HMX28780.1 transglutaminase-like domain-containing protein [Blastocatellia bacterium]HMY70633.1 transglutaminase-like domain-containing protein [Blastocatellia bacterium]HMZ21197.1 transglutaminase-like domain-containing protein [Blastocatellia bacterium]
MTKEEARAQFQELISRRDSMLELDRAALLIAAEEYPQLEVEHYLRQLDAFAEAAKVGNDSSPYYRIQRINQVLFDELGFHGNAGNYYDARNSFLNEVMERRTGIPITLSVIYLEVARRMGINLFGVGMPGHFLVKYSDEEEEIFIDPFHNGRILTVDQCREMIFKMYEGKMEFQLAFLRAVTKKQILTRMLQNLKGVYARALAHHKTLSVIERVLLITPASATELRDRGLVFWGMKLYVQAQADLEEYLRRNPAAEDSEEIKKRLLHVKHRLAQWN